MPAVGTATLNSIVRHYILPQVTDNVYLKNNALLYRLIRTNKRMVQGGTQIEIPLLYKRFSVGGTYRGFDLLDVAPQDTIKNAFLEWKQHYVTFAVDGLTLIKADSPLAVANLLNLLGQQMYMEMAENLSNGVVLGDGTTDVKDIDGLPAIVSASNTYGGLDRTTETWWRAQIDSAAAALSFTKMRALYSSCIIGAEHPTIILGNGVNYGRLWALMTSTTGYSVVNNREPGGHDELLAQAGFTNLLFENIPFVREDTLANTHVYMLNENFIALVVSPRGDFYLEDFQKPVNQDAYISTLTWAGNLITMNARTQGAMTALNG